MISQAAAPDRREFLRNAGLVAVGGLSGGLFTGCGRAPDAIATKPGAAGTGAPAPVSEAALIAAARQEGKLVLYTGSEESIVVNLGKAFRETYGIALEYQRLNSGEIAARYTAEAQAGRTVADVVLTGDHELFQIFGKKNWLARLDSLTVPRLAAWPSEYKDEHTATVSIIPYTMALNTEQVRTTPKDWTFLLSPELRGGIVTLDARRVNLVAIAAWDLMLKLHGDEFLKKVGQQQLRLVDSGPSAVQQLASGAAKVYFPCSRTNAESMSAQGAPVKAVLPESAPFTGVMMEVAMSVAAAHPNAARLFAGFLLSEQGQKLLNVVASSPGNLPGALPLSKQFVRPDFVSTAANRSRINELLGM